MEWRIMKDYLDGRQAKDQHRFDRKCCPSAFIGRSQQDSLDRLNLEKGVLDWKQAKPLFLHSVDTDQSLDPVWGGLLQGLSGAWKLDSRQWLRLQILISCSRSWKKSRGCWNSPLQLYNRKRKFHVWIVSGIVCLLVVALAVVLLQSMKALSIVRKSGYQRNWSRSYGAIRLKPLSWKEYSSPDRLNHRIIFMSGSVIFPDFWRSWIYL